MQKFDLSFDYSNAVWGPRQQSHLVQCFSAPFSEIKWAERCDGVKPIFWQHVPRFLFALHIAFLGLETGLSMAPVIQQTNNPE